MIIKVAQQLCNTVQPVFRAATVLEFHPLHSVTGALWHEKLVMAVREGPKLHGLVATAMTKRTVQFVDRFPVLLKCGINYQSLMTLSSYLLVIPGLAVLSFEGSFFATMFVSETDWFLLPRCTECLWRLKCLSGSGAVHTRIWLHIDWFCP